MPSSTRFSHQQIAAAKAAPRIAASAGRGAAAVGRGVATAAGHVAGTGIAAAKMAARPVGALMRRLRSGDDYTELMQTLSQLDENEINQLISQLNEHELQFVEQLFESNDMQSRYTTLRERLLMKFDESVTQDNIDALQKRLAPRVVDTKMAKPWNTYGTKMRHFGPFGAKPNAKPRRKDVNRSTIRGVSKLGEEAPVNSVGAGENIAGINPPAGPGALTSRNLRGVAAGKTPEDIANHHGVSLKKIQKQLEMGSRVEREHTDNAATAMKIAMDHVMEDPNYYTKLARMEGTKKESYSIGNDTRFNPRGDRLAKYRVTTFETRRQTTNRPGDERI